MSAVMAPPTVDYLESARRHLADAHILQDRGRLANAGQLFGFSVECGLKALLLACGVMPDPKGGIPWKHAFHTHMPKLNDQIVASGHLIPDGARANQYRAMLPSIGDMADWDVGHRYFKEADIPVASLPKWDMAALEVNEMLDKAVADGVL